MSNVISKVRAGLFAVAAAAALGFGGTQAFATPTAPESAALLCDDARCNTLCQRNGSAWGYCSTSWSCTCE